MQEKALLPHPHVLLFDLGGVVFRLGYEEAVARFENLGLKDAKSHLDASEQKGIFGILERGEISKEEFRHRFSELVGHDVTLEECAYAWLGYMLGVPQANLEALKTLRKAGYRVCLLSNTNYFMLDHVRSGAFDGHGNGIDYYFDRVYASCECHMMKPGKAIFRHVIDEEGVKACDILFLDDSERNTSAAHALGYQTLLVRDADGWIEPLSDLLGISLS